MTSKNPFQLNKTTMALVAVFLGLFLFGASKCAKAEPRLTFEAGAAVVRASTPAARLSVEWPEAGPKSADFQCGLALVGPYDFKGANANQAVFDCLLVTKPLPGFSVGLGPAYLQNVDQINGSHFNFALMARYRFGDRWSLAWRHWSNAGTKPPNYGRDLLVLGYSF